MPRNTTKQAILHTPKKTAPPVIKPHRLTVPAWAPFAVLAFTALLYARALQNGFTSLDDDYYILKNPFIKDFSFEGIRAIFSSFYSYNYHPLTTLTYLFEYRFFGIWPLPYHLLNVVLHLSNTWLVFKLAGRLSGKKTTALVVCVLFAIHPMHVESVAWVSERKDVLYAFFYLLSLLQYLHYCADGFQKKHYAGTLLYFTASLFSKSAAVTLPLLLIAIDIYKGRKTTARSLAEKAPFFLLSVVFGILNIMAQAKGGAISDSLLATGFANRIFLFTSALSFYSIKLLAPYGLSAMHYFPQIVNGMLPWPYYLSLPFLLLVTWFILRRTPYRREMIFGVAFFLITISVMLQVLAVGSTLTAERYTYIPYIGLFYIVGQWLSRIRTIKRQKIALWASAAVLLVYTIQTWNRIGVWKDDEALFRDIADSYPSVYLQYYEQGNAKKKIAHFREALQQYNVAILLSPGFAKAYVGRGEIYDLLDSARQAMQDYDKAISLDGRLAEAYNGRGLEYSRSGKLTPAIQDFSKAIMLDPGYAEAYNNRGWMYYQQGNAQAAMPDYRRSVALDTGNSMAYNNIGWAYCQAGKMDSAVLYFDKAIRYNPRNNFAVSNRALVKANTGDLAGAIQDYDTLIKLNPGTNLNYYNRGMVRYYLKDTAGAKDDWKKSAALGNKNAANLLK